MTEIRLTEKARIAIVEDKDMLRELYAAVLGPEAAGYDVSTFEKAENLLASDFRKLNVAIVDLQLGGGMHGVTLIRELSMHRVRTVAITGSDPTVRSQALLTGASVALQKPISNRSLVLAVELALAMAN